MLLFVCELFLVAINHTGGIICLQVFSSDYSSLYCIISFSFCSFSYNGVCYDGFKRSVSDVIVSQKGSNGDRKLQFFGGYYNFTHTLCSKIHLWAKICLYAKEQSVRVKNLLSALQNFAQNECALRY